MLAGGYLILDRSFSGLVVSSDARIHSKVTTVEKQKEHKDLKVISLSSPQFDWKGTYSLVSQEKGTFALQPMLVNFYLYFFFYNLISAI